MKSENEDKFNEFCRQVIDIDPSIRFAGIANEDGALESIAERKDLVPLLTPEEELNTRLQLLHVNTHV